MSATETLPPSYTRPYTELCAQNLPAYTANADTESGATPSPVIDLPTREFTYDIANYWKKPWAALCVRGNARLSRDVPVILEGTELSGSVWMRVKSAREAAAMKAVYVVACGDLITSATLPLRINFFKVRKNVWSKTEGDMLVGEHTYAFSVQLPEYTNDSKVEGARYRLPHPFFERYSKIGIDYYLELHIEREGRLRADDTLSVRFGYFTMQRPSGLSLPRLLAHQRNTMLPGPYVDPEGWHLLETVDVKGRAFGHRDVDVKLTVFLAKPLCYTRGTVIPCAMTIETTDTLAADFFGALTSSGLFLERCARWWPSPPYQTPQSVKERYLLGELHLAKDLHPSTAMKQFRVEYSVVLFPPEAVGFVPRDKFGPLRREKVDVVTRFPAGWIGTTALCPRSQNERLEQEDDRIKTRVAVRHHDASTMTTPFLDAVAGHLPSELTESLDQLKATSPDAGITVDGLIRFVAGGAAPNADSQPSWAEKQAAATKALSALAGPNTNGKRQREDEGSAGGSEAKRQKTDPSPPAEDLGPPLFTLHAISANSPVRRKVDITIYSDSVSFVNASTSAVEATIPLSVLKRAFLLPTRGKTKPHWTVVVLSVDVTDPANKKDKAKEKEREKEQPQVIFGLDASATVKYTTYTGESATPEVTTLKSAPTRDLLLNFIRRLRLPVLEPTPTVFRSACPGIAASASEGGVPGAEAYRGAKVGTLWFMRQGLLFGEGKPFEFWAVSDLLGRDEGLRIISATGRTCTVILARKSSPAERAELEEDEKDMGVETALTMVDGREQEGINKWVREHRSLFGKEEVQGQGSAMLVQDDSDEEDGDFVDDKSSDGGSASSDSEAESDDADTAEDDDGEGSDDADGDGEAMEQDGAESEDEEEELRPENHPPMRPGAMPRMSRAAIDTVAAMVTEDLVGGDEEDGEDELDE
ncbi:Rtt106 domain-containing protein [Mycena kentingensis (nom. inval.)]|nr:Rtt106 domain-containing protein [Mycena kentingensis (nom. inval.)]